MGEDVTMMLLLFLLFPVTIAGLVLFGLVFGFVALLLKLVFHILLFVTGIYFIMAVVKKIAKS